MERYLREHIETFKQAAKTSREFGYLKYYFTPAAMEGMIQEERKLVDYTDEDNRGVNDLPIRVEVMKQKGVPEAYHKLGIKLLRKEKLGTKNMTDMVRSLPGFGAFSIMRTNPKQK